MKTVGVISLWLLNLEAQLEKLLWGELVAPIGAGRRMKQPGTQEPRVGLGLCLHSVGRAIHALAEDRFLPLANIY